MTCIVDHDDEEHTHFYVSEVLGLYCCFFYVLVVLALFYVTFFLVI